MKFKPRNFRSLSSDAAIGLRSDRRMTLILIQSTGEASYDRTRQGKDDIIGKWDPAKDLLLLAWTGEYGTDIFHLTKADVDFHYDPKHA